MIVYIWGNLTENNFTPRVDRDTVGRPGQQPGLSASDKIPPGRKAQGIETDRLRPPLRAFPDDPQLGGTPGHFAIAPCDENGEVDVQRLQEWANSRNIGVTHELTRALLDAVVIPNAR